MAGVAGVGAGLGESGVRRMDIGSGTLGREFFVPLPPIWGVWLGLERVGKGTISYK